MMKSKTKGGKKLKKKTNQTFILFTIEMGATEGFMKAQIEQLEEENKKLKEDNKRLREGVNAGQRLVEDLISKNKNLKEKVETLELWLDNKEKLNKEYRKNIDKYKKQYEHSMGFMEEDTLQELKDIGEL